MIILYQQTYKKLFICLGFLAIIIAVFILFANQTLGQTSGENFIYYTIEGTTNYAADPDTGTTYLFDTSSETWTVISENPDAISQQDDGSLIFTDGNNIVWVGINNTWQPSEEFLDQIGYQYKIGGQNYQVNPNGEVSATDTGLEVPIVDTNPAAEIQTQICAPWNLWCWTQKIIAEIAKAIMHLELKLIQLVFGLVDWVVNPNTFGYTRQQTPTQVVPLIVQKAWSITLQFANLFIVLILLIIAFATILRMESYGAKQLLTRLILVAIFINFSLLISGAIIDLGNVPTQIMLRDIRSANSNLGSGLATAFIVTTTGVSRTGNNISLTAVFWGLFIHTTFAFTAIIIGLTLFIMFLYRYAVLWIAVIFAPLVWVFAVIPKYQRFYAEWWEKFLQWVIYAPVAVLFIYLAFLAAYGTADNSIPASLPQQATVGGEGFWASTQGFINNFGGQLGSAFILISLLVAAIIVPAKIAGGAGQAIMGGISGAVGGFVGAGAGAAGRGALQRWASTERGSRTLERMGTGTGGWKFVPGATGLANRIQGLRLEDVEALSKNMSGWSNQSLGATLKTTAGWAKNRRITALKIGLDRSSDDFNEITEGLSDGDKKRVFAESIPELTKDRKNVKTVQALAKKLPNIKELTQAAGYADTNEMFDKMDEDDFRNIDKNPAAKDVLIQQYSTRIKDPKKRSAMLSAIKKKWNSIFEQADEFKTFLAQSKTSIIDDTENFGQFLNSVEDETWRKSGELPKFMESVVKKIGPKHIQSIIERRGEVLGELINQIKTHAGTSGLPPQQAKTSVEQYLKNQGMLESEAALASDNLIRRNKFIGRLLTA